jgi:hypothetical protein
MQQLDSLSISGAGQHQRYHGKTVVCGIKMRSPDMPEKLPVTLSRRFPHLQVEFLEMINRVDSFRNLCLDYEELVQALEKSGTGNADDSEDLLNLKTSLEVELLEAITHSGMQQ